MYRLLNWKRSHWHFPTDNYTWNLLLGERLKRFFSESGFLSFDNSVVDNIEIGGESYKVDFIDGKYIAYNDELDDVELTSNDVLRVCLDKRAFGDAIRKLLNIGNAVSDMPKSDAYCLGDLTVGDGYRVFLCFSDSSAFSQDVRSLSKGTPPLVISFDEISSDTQKLVFDLEGKFLKIEDCIKFEEYGIEPLSSIRELLGSPRKKSTSNALYCWSSSGFHQPKIPTLAMLKIKILSSTSAEIIFDGEGGEFDYQSISIFRNGNTGEMTKTWLTMGALASGKRLKKDNSTRKLVSRMNAAFRDFFKFSENLLPFGFTDGLLSANFGLSIPKSRVRKDRFDGGGTSEKDLVQDYEEKRRNYEI